MQKNAMRNELSPTRSQCRKKLLILYPVDNLHTYFSTYVFLILSVWNFILQNQYVLAKLVNFEIIKLQEIGIRNSSLVSLFWWSHFYLLKNCICIFITRVHLYLTLCVFEKSALNVSVFVFVQKKFLDKGQFWLRAITK